MDTENLQNVLMCVQYPGRVDNVDTMIKSLGGINQISETFNIDHRRMQLKFRPDSVYAKYAYGDRSHTTGILLKVKIRRRKADSPANDATTQSISILGMIHCIYKFESICDFQYLPIVEDSGSKKAICIYDDLVPQGMQSPDWLTSGEGVPYFLPPLSFSRFDTMQPNLFRKEQPKGDNDNDDGLIGKTRLRRIKQASYVPFNLSDAIPEQQLTMTVAHEYLKVKFITSEQFEAVKALFDRRPIMSKMVVSYETKITNDKLKYILPILCYYYTTGPWRIMWVRFGYDPRKDFESRYYQQLDYRVRLHTGIKDHIDLKSYTSAQKTVKKGSLKVQANVTDRQKKENIIYYPYFESGRLPQSRQCIYQYCDIRVAKIQEMLDKIPTPLTGAICNEKSGWLPPNFDDQCREILSDIIKELISKNKESGENEYVEEEEMYTDDDDQLDDNIDDSDNELDTSANSQ